VKSKYFYLYLIIFLEGYVVLATELLAMRQLIPFVGSGTETVAIIIAAVLMPLAFGYYFGGKFEAKPRKCGILTVRKKLIRNILISTVFLVIGLSYVVLEGFFVGLGNIGINHRVLQTFTYVMIFLVAPIFLLGQTVPLISNFFMRENLSKLTGKILFFSTVGSFMGAILSTIILMSIIGVNNTVIVNILILFIVSVVISKNFIDVNNIVMAMLLGASVLFNSNYMMQSLGIVENNRYSTIKIGAPKDLLPNDLDMDGKVININRSSSGKYTPDQEKRFDYIKYIEKGFINPLIKTKNKKKILIIGAGGFTLGVDDNLNDYTFVDIDSSLKEVSEKYLLPPGKLGANKKFDPQDARAFLNSNKDKYDLIVLDAFTNIYSVPTHLLTVEFFGQVNAHLADGGIMLFNCIATPLFNTRYSVKIDNTLKKIFPSISRQIIQEFNGWYKGSDMNMNIIYMYFKQLSLSDVYTDDKNTYFLDH
jgi:hypothetical protein